MPTTTRRKNYENGSEKPANTRKRKQQGKSAESKTILDEKEDTKGAAENGDNNEGLPSEEANGETKDQTADTMERPSKKSRGEKGSPSDRESYSFQAGVVERGHIYFFYRPKVEHEEAHDIDDVKNFHMLLVPRPPEFSVHSDKQQARSGGDKEPGDDKLNLIREGGDAVPAPEDKNTSKKHFRLITIGRKRLPDPNHGGRKETFWATVTAVGDDLHDVERGLMEKTYETKTRGTRHEEPVRLAGRGAYAIVNSDASAPSKRETHLGYHLSHPAEPSDVQKQLGLYKASSFVLQVKNPLAPVTGPQRVGLPSARRAEYPEAIMDQIFGKGKQGRESYGLRFSNCEHPDLLEYEGAELLLIAARSGTQGNDTSLGEGRGEALEEAQEQESHESISDIFKELATDNETFPAAPLRGEWI